MTVGVQVMCDEYPTLATAVDELCAEVERLQDKLKLTTVQRDLSRAAVKGVCRVIKPRGDA